MSTVPKLPLLSSALPNKFEFVPTPAPIIEPNIPTEFDKFEVEFCLGYSPNDTLEFAAAKAGV